MKPTLLSTSIGVALACLTVHANAQDCQTALTGAQATCTDAQDPKQCLRDALPSQCRHLAESTGDTQTLPTYTVVGTGFGIDVDKYPGSASVLTTEDLTFSPDIIRLLAQVPGFDTGNDFGRSVGQSFSIRGFGHGSDNRVILMQDGVRRSANLFANQISSLRMDPDLLKEVDVVRGASSINHGGGAIGGVVNATTKDPIDFLLPGRDLGGSVKLRYDSNNQRHGYASFAYAPVDQSFDFMVYGKRAEMGDIKLPKQLTLSNGSTLDRSEYDGQSTSLFVKAGWAPADGHRLTLSHSDFKEDVETTWNSLFHVEFPVNDDEVDTPTLGILEQTDTILRYQANPENSQWLDLNAAVYTSEAFYERGYDPGLAGYDLYYKNEDKRRGLSLENLMNFVTGPVKHKLLIGTDYENRKEDGIYILDGEQTVFNSMPNEYKDLGIFFSYETLYLDERLSLLLGGRYDQFDREVKGVAEDYDNSRFSPRIGLGFEAAPGFTLLANYSETFRAPTPHETSSEGQLNPYYWYQPNPDLDSETAGEYELGFSWRKPGLFIDGDNFRTKIMYFQGTIKDMIALVIDRNSTAPNNTQYVQYRNVGEVDRDGVEVEMSYDQQRWGTFLTYETLDQFDTTTRAKSPYAFADRARFGLSWYPIADNFRVTADVTHWFAPDQNPETVVSGGQTLRYVYKSFSQSNMQIAWRPQLSGVGFLDGSTEILFGVNNVFNQKRIQASNVQTSTRIGTGRNIYLSIAKQF